MDDHNIVKKAKGIREARLLLARFLHICQYVVPSYVAENSQMDNETSQSIIERLLGREIIHSEHQFCISSQRFVLNKLDGDLFVMKYAMHADVR